MELPSMSNGDSACLLGDDDSKTVAFLGYSECSPMTQSKTLRNIAVVGNGEDTSCRHKPVVADNKRTIVEGGILKEDVLYQTLTDVCIYLLTCIGKLFETYMILNDYESSDLLFSHAHARHHNRHDVGLIRIVFRLTMKIATEYRCPSCRTDGGEEVTYIVLE